MLSMTHLFRKKNSERIKGGLQRNSRGIRRSVGFRSIDDFPCELNTIACAYIAQRLCIPISFPSKSSPRMAASGDYTLCQPFHGTVQQCMYKMLSLRVLPGRGRMGSCCGLLLQPCLSTWIFILHLCKQPCIHEEGLGFLSL